MESRTLQIFRNIDFKKYFGMNLASTSANSVASLVIVWYVFTVTQSPLDVALVGIAETVSAVILSLPAGVWIDRYNRIWILVISNIARAICVTFLIIFSLIYGFNLIVIIILLFAWNGAAEVFRSGNHAILPDMISRYRLADANGIVRTGTNLFSSASNAIGGTLIVVVGASFALSYVSVGFFVALLFSIFLFGSAGNANMRKAERITVKKNGFTEIREGFAWLLSERGLFWLTFSSLPFNFFFTISYYFLVVYVVNAVHSGSFVYGAILAAYAIGYSIGSPIVGRTKWALKYPGRIWELLYGAVIGTAIILMGVFPISYLAILFSSAMGLAVGFAGNVWLTASQNIVPERFRGRYFAIDGLISFIGGPPAVAAGGVLVLSLGIIHTFEISGIIMLISALGFSLIKSLWNLDGTGVKDTESTFSE